MATLTDQQMQQVKSVFDSYGIPQFVWQPIMMQESGGDPNAHPDYGTGENSQGLFQINMGVHPQYANQNLYDPVTNATIAARDFIAPAYNQALTNGLSNPASIASYVWQNGIRPNWSLVSSNGKVAQLQQQATSIYQGNPVPLSQATGGSGSGSASSGSSSSGSWTDFFNPATWKNGLTKVFWVMIGAAAIILGIYLATNPLANLSNVIEKVSEGVKPSE